MSSPAIAPRKRIASTGEIFGDGSMIELVSGPSETDGPSLLFWDGDRPVIAPRIEHGDFIYEALDLPPSLYRAIRLPSHCDDYGSARGLFASITDLFKHRLDLPERESGLLACFTIASWLADRLPTAPLLMISGPEQEMGIYVLGLLECLCRHPLMSADVTAGALRSLPTQFGFTLLVCQEGTNSRMERLFRASRFRGVHLLGNRGKVIDLYGPKAIFCGNDAVDLGGGAIEVSAAPSRMTISSALDLRVQDEIAEHFQPRLLMYRLKNCGKLPESPVEVSGFTFATQQLARAIAACFPDDPELALEAVELLRPQDDAVRGQGLCDVNRVIVEILWSMIHGGTPKVMVEALAADVNALLRSRGEILAYRSEEIGWKLRGLNIARHTSSRGRQITLGRETSERVHRLAEAYGLPREGRVDVRCPHCDRGEPVLSK